MKALLFFVALLSTTSLAADFSLKKSEYNGFPNTLRARDFFTMTTKAKNISRLPQLPKLSEESCRENIQRVMCLVDPAKENEKPLDRQCLEGGQEYAKYFEGLYDNYPPVLQKMFCSVRRIFIEKDFFGTAYAAQLRDGSGNSIGAIVGIRKSVLDSGLDLQHWASWKEQLSFGGNPHDYAYSPNLPTIATHSETKANDFLYFVIAHEFGHIFDFANGLNQTTNCPPPSNSQDEAECPMAPGSWGSLSWITDKRARPEHEFALRTGLCFYTCGDHPLSAADVLGVYQGIAPTSFISLYATTEPWDDFADSLAYFLTRKYLATTYRIDTNQGFALDITQKLESPVFAEKYRYIENFLQRTDIAYP